MNAYIEYALYACILTISLAYPVGFIVGILEILPITIWVQ